MCSFFHKPFPSIIWPQSFNLTHYRSVSTIWISGGKVRSASTASLVPGFFWTYVHSSPPPTILNLQTVSWYGFLLLPVPPTSPFLHLVWWLLFLLQLKSVLVSNLACVWRGHTCYAQEPFLPGTCKNDWKSPGNSICLLPQPTSAGVLFFSVLSLDHSWVNLLYFWLHYNLSH